MKTVAAPDLTFMKARKENDPVTKTAISGKPLLVHLARNLGA